MATQTHTYRTYVVQSRGGRCVLVTIPAGPGWKKWPSRFLGLQSRSKRSNDEGYICANLLCFFGTLIGKQSEMGMAVHLSGDINVKAVKPWKKRTIPSPCIPKMAQRKRNFCRYHEQEWKTSFSLSILSHFLHNSVIDKMNDSYNGIVWILMRKKCSREDLKIFG